MALKEDIRYVKSSFPELKFMHISGTYKPIEELLENNCQAGIRYSALALTRENLESKKARFIMGLGKIYIPNSLDCQEFSLQRRGIIAHELSHFCFFPLDVSGSQRERQVDEEAVRRGFGNELLEAITFLENVHYIIKKGHKRTGYSSQELRKNLDDYPNSGSGRRDVLHSE